MKPEIRDLKSEIRWLRASFGRLRTALAVSLPLSWFRFLQRAFPEARGMVDFRTLALAKNFYLQGRAVRFPYHLREQFERSSLSVPLNLVEGNAKSSPRDKLKFFEIAYGSFREAQVVLELGGIKNPELLKTSDDLGAHLYQLIRALKARG